MKIVDLTQTLFHHMPVYPGDPEVEIEQVHTLEQEGWRLQRVTMSTHSGTHVNAPSHMVENGPTLDGMALDAFFGRAVLYTAGMRFRADQGVIFSACNIDQDIADQLIQTPPKFVGLSEAYDVDVAVEKLLLEHGIISYENLANTEQLTGEFDFFGLPLKIQAGDGSPVRAYAVLAEPASQAS